MIHAGPRFHEVVHQTVSRVEARTNAEIVVVAAARSGSYRDVAFAAASAGTMGLLVLMLFSPYVIPPAGVVIELGIAWPLLAWLFGGPRSARLLTTQARRNAQARAAAEHEFVREAVHATRQRTGVLVYLSSLEGRVEVIADVGILGAVPPGALASAMAQFRHDDLDHFVAGIEALGAVFAQYVPPHDDPERIELADAPRVRT